MPAEGQENSSFSMNPFYGHYLGSPEKKNKKRLNEGYRTAVILAPNAGNNSSDFLSPCHWANKETQIQFPKGEGLVRWWEGKELGGNN